MAVHDIQGADLSDAALRAARSVAKITWDERAPATGFLIAPDILMTNEHVFPNKDEARTAVVQFSAEDATNGNLWACDPESLFDNDKPLDYAVVRVRRAGVKAGGVAGVEKGETLGWLSLDRSPMTKADTLNIIHYPGGQSRQIDTNIQVVDVTTPPFVRYGSGEIDGTTLGSSGAPVFDSQWQVVALHHGNFKVITGPPGARIHLEGDEGTLISYIIERLREKAPPQWQDEDWFKSLPAERRMRNDRRVTSDRRARIDRRIKF